MYYISESSAMHVIVVAATVKDTSQAIHVTRIVLPSLVADPPDVSRWLERGNRVRYVETSRFLLTKRIMGRSRGVSHGNRLVLPLWVVCHCHCHYCSFRSIADGDGRLGDSLPAVYRRRPSDLFWIILRMIVRIQYQRYCRHSGNRRRFGTQDQRAQGYELNVVGGLLPQFFQLHKLSRTPSTFGSHQDMIVIDWRRL